MEDRLRRIVLDDGRYTQDAFRFLLEGLEVAIQLAGKQEADGLERHITGRDVLRGLEEHGRRLFGPLTPTVWRRWGIRSGLDWGQIVFLLVEHGHLSRQESDTLDDFRGWKDIKAAFTDYRPELPKRLGA